MPEDWERYAQESGRAGTDEKFACALLFNNMWDLDTRCVSKHIEYCVGMPSKCRRLILYREFPDCKFILLVEFVVMDVQRCINVEIVTRF